MRSRNFREKVQNLFDCEVKRDHCTCVTSRYAFFYEVILSEKFLLHRPPHNLQQILLLAQMFLDFFVEVFESFLYLARRILGDDFAKLLLGKSHLIAHFGLFDALLNFRLNAFEELLRKSNEKFGQKFNEAFKNSHSISPAADRNISSRNFSAHRHTAPSPPFSCFQAQRLWAAPVASACDDNSPFSRPDSASLDVQLRADWCRWKLLPPAAHTTYPSQFVARFSWRFSPSTSQTPQNSQHSKVIRTLSASELSLLQSIAVEVAWICQSFAWLERAPTRKSCWGRIANLVLSSRADWDERRRRESSCGRK